MQKKNCDCDEKLRKKKENLDEKLKKNLPRVKTVVFAEFSRRKVKKLKIRKDEKDFGKKKLNEEDEELVK